MDNKIRCQSCGMPLGVGFFGANSDGSVSEEYCKFCWKDGKFTHPDQTMDDMIALSIENMVSEVGLSEVKARELANTYIPQLKRWKTN